MNNYFRITTFLVLSAAFAFTTHISDKHTYELIIFEGSDWCSNCIRLEKNVLSKGDFTRFLETNEITLKKVDFPQKNILSENQKIINNQIAEKYQFDGNFPTIVLSRTDIFKYERLQYDNQTVEVLKKEILTQLKRIQ